MPTGPESSWHTGNLLGFRSSVARTSASGITNFSAARLHAFSVVIQCDLLFVTAVLSPRCSTYPCKFPFSGCQRKLNLAQAFVFFKVFLKGFPVITYGALQGLNPAFTMGSLLHDCLRMVGSQSQQYISC